MTTSGNDMVARKKVLGYLARHTGDECVLPFAPICKGTKLPRQRVRKACRALARKGLASFHSGLCTDDGDFAGSGYCVTAAGITALTQTRSEGE